MRLCQCMATVAAALIVAAGGTGRANVDDDLGSPSTVVANEHAGASVLLVLELATDQTGRSGEQRFVNELELALDGIQIRTIKPEDSDFSDLPLRKQIERVRPLIERHGAAAAAWLDEVSADLMLLHMVAVSSGRALARLIEIEPRAGFETDLALAARELLGTAFLFQEPPVNRPSPIRRVVESVRQEAAGELLKPPSLCWSATSYADLEGGVWGHSGPSILVGGTLALAVGYRAGLTGRLSLGAKAGPLEGRDKTVSLFRAAAGPGVLYLFDLGPVLLGPALDLQINWLLARVNDPHSSRRRFTHWMYRISAGLELHWQLAQRFALAAGAGLGVTPEREAYRYEAIDHTVLVTPYVSWETRLGLVFKIR